MSNDATIVGGDVAEPRSRAGRPTLRLRLNEPRRNVALRIADITTTMAASVPDAFTDLLEIATYVYCADQAVPRGGAGVENVGAEWRRNLTFRVPVRVPGLWNSNAMREALTSTLGFLSDDNYSFEFAAFAKTPPIQNYLVPRENAADQKIQEVTLFSGGLDSLGGAVHESIVSGKRIALVTHQPSMKLAPRQRRLLKELTDRSNFPPLFVPISINKAKSLGREPTQRSRSFLFAALAATVAQALGLNRIRFYENGVVSLNLPPLAQIVGAKATRTTHPQVLRGFERILTLVAGRQFDVESPFLWTTRADVVQQIVKAGCASMIRETVSCMHTWEMTNDHPHCGSCSQCIGRRLAVLASGAAQDDPEDGYKVRLLDGARDDNESRTMVASLVSAADAITRMSAVEFFEHYGEASRVLRHVGESPDSAALKIYELHRRHAEQVTCVIDSAISKFARQIREGNLPPTCLVRLVSDGSGPCPDQPEQDRKPPNPDKPKPTSYFLKKGERAWAVRFDGGREFLLLRSKGAAYLQVLLSNPNQAYTAPQLVALVARVPESFLLGDASDRTDAPAMSAYRARYSELTDELDRARKNGDEAEQSRVRSDMEDFAAHLRGETGLRGRARKNNDDREQARKSLRAAVRRTLAEIRKEDHTLWKHLNATVKCGWNPCYRPNPVVDWAI